MLKARVETSGFLLFYQNDARIGALLQDVTIRELSLVGPVFKQSLRPAISLAVQFHFWGAGAKYSQNGDQLQGHGVA